MAAPNIWMRNASVLAEAYVRDAGMVGFELVTRSLIMHLPRTPQRIVDVGGGYGQQAIMLANQGHSVVIVDIDPNMLAIARERLSHQSRDVRARVDLILGDGHSASSLVGTEFDLACCHNVLMYQDHAAPLLLELVDLVRDGGLISVVSLNGDAYAMRSGLQGRWREAVHLLKHGETATVGPIPTRRHSRKEIERILIAAGATVRTWHGVGVFTDHLTETIVTEDPEMVYMAEWIAGNQDPYREVARCFHMLAQRDHRPLKS